MIAGQGTSDNYKYSYVAALLDAKNGDRLTQYHFNATNALRGKPVVYQSDAYYLSTSHLVSNLESV
jgi:hypothetical protein